MSWEQEYGMNASDRTDLKAKGVEDFNEAFEDPTDVQNDAADRIVAAIAEYLEAGGTPATLRKLVDNAL